MKEKVREYTVEFIEKLAFTQIRAMSLATVGRRWI